MRPGADERAEEVLNKRTAAGRVHEGGGKGMEIKLQEAALGGTKWDGGLRPVEPAIGRRDRGEPHEPRRHARVEQAQADVTSGTGGGVMCEVAY